MSPLPSFVYVVVAGVVAAVAPISIPKSWTPRERTAAGLVDAASIAAHVRFLSDDLLEGRGPASRGSELAMKYVAAQFERLGLEPAGDDHGFQQKFDIVGLKTKLVGAPV